MKSRKYKVFGLLAIALALVAATAPATSAKVAPGKAKSAVEAGGLKELIKLAKKEGQVNTIALPDYWANYGEVKKAFEAKYGIKVNSFDPEASSAEELVAVRTLKGQDRMPDVVDVGLQFAVQGAQEGLWAPYKVSTWNDIPNDAKEANGLWYSDYGGYIAIGYDANVVKTPPKSFADLLNPIYKNQVALNGDPTASNSAFLSVLATSVAAGGGVKGANNINFALDYWKQMKASGNFVPVAATPATVASGQTPILLDWDYLHAKYKDQAGRVDWRVVVPSDAVLGGFYAQAVVKNSPNPAAARLWQEFLYSDEGQNLWLKGGARPIRLDAMVKAKKHDRTAFAALPAVPKNAKPIFPSLQQQLLARATLTPAWPKL
ncbi:MAG: extracellular solute-binding protein [Actinobacteria bacterium]|jgi:putative spermidine/putrescine transport system substrate-binding protein|nr:extracellular solute-binding protein [Actinomycetota bacterium]NCV96080.1 extracellular solute-binding protein [Actinomycetota bacterium]NCW93823.1 extracellular solute-binding protein [Actinomycetota bacterium]NCW97000.1 extracellular solute-binding protein [Actinomycetota bacterium]NCX00708.1 extracellular solute-binding protein [Actinomycetota bacterium]